MAIYRPKASRWPAIVAALIVGIVIGLVIGFALLGSRPASVQEAAAQVRSSLDGAAGLLDVVSIEYAEAVQDGAVVAEVEYQGSLDALARSRARFSEAEAALAAIDPAHAAAILAAYQETEASMRRPAPSSEVDAAIASLEAMLRGTQDG